MVQLLLSGCNGRMGHAVEAICAAEPELELTAGFDLLGADIRSCGEMHEYYDGDRGAPVINPGFQNWNLLAINMGAWLHGEPAVSEI